MNLPQGGSLPVALTHNHGASDSSAAPLASIEYFAAARSRTRPFPLRMLSTSARPPQMPHRKPPEPKMSDRISTLPRKPRTQAPKTPVLISATRNPPPRTHPNSPVLSSTPLTISPQEPSHPFPHRPRTLSPLPRFPCHSSFCENNRPAERPNPPTDEPCSTTPPFTRCPNPSILSAMNDRITFNPNQCGGRPCIRGMRIRVKDVLDLLAAKVPESEILEDYPYLEPDDIAACLEYAATEADHPVLIAR